MAATIDTPQVIYISPTTPQEENPEPNNIPAPIEELLTDNKDEVSPQTQEEQSSDKKEKKKGLIVIDFDKESEEKQYANFYLSKKTLSLIEKFAGKKKDGKHKTGMNKSQLVDYLLQQAFEMLEVKNK
jgi:hypothetical protein